MTCAEWSETGYFSNFTPSRNIDIKLSYCGVPRTNRNLCVAITKNAGLSAFLFRGAEQLTQPL